MNKLEWKKLYHEYRRGMFDFNQYMASHNFPCGYDDMLYGQHEGATMDFIESSHPALKKVLDIIDSTDELQWRADDLSWYQDSPEHKVKRLSQMVTRYREAV